MMIPIACFERTAHDIRCLLFSFFAFVSCCIQCAPTPSPNADTTLLETATATLPSETHLIPHPPSLHAKGYMLIDADSGLVLAKKNPQVSIPPASLTKMMSLYLAAHALQKEEIHLTDKVTISQRAWKATGSRMFVKVGSQVPVKDLIKGIVVDSGNDACVALAEHIAGSEAAFVDLMNQAAANLGLKNSHFTSSTGLPNKNHYSTPEDLATLARALLKQFPQYQHWYKEKWFTYNNIRQPNRNRLLWRDTAVNGIKTGHTKEAGFCLATSAHKNNMHLIAIVVGDPSDALRVEDSQALLNFGFRFYETHKLYVAHTPITQARVWMGEKKSTPLGLMENIYVTIAKGQYKELSASMDVAAPLHAPLIKGQPYGHVTVYLNGHRLQQVPLIALASNEKGRWVSQITDRVLLFVQHWLSHDTHALIVPQKQPASRPLPAQS